VASFSLIAVANPIRPNGKVDFPFPDFFFFSILPPLSYAIHNPIHLLSSVSDSNNIKVTSTKITMAKSAPNCQPTPGCTLYK